MHPQLRQTLGDGVSQIADGHLILMLLAVMAGRAWLGLLNEVSRFEMDVGSALFIAAAPPPQADHLVVRLPCGEGVVGGVKADEASAVAHVCLESGFGFVR